MTAWSELGERTWGRAAIASALALLSFVSVFIAQHEQGIVHDEVVYMRYGERYAEWWGALLSGDGDMVSEEAITEHFGGEGETANNREHPPLMKTLSGFTHWLFFKELAVTDELSAFRIPSAAMNALLVALIFLFCASRWGSGVGIVAGLCTLLLPRAFFHAGLACFDAAIVTMWMATLMAYHRAVTWRGSWLTVGVVFGLALATKHNALMLPGVMGAHYLFLAARSQWSSANRKPGITGKFLALWVGIKAVRPSVIASLAIVSPLVLIAVWPWLWLDPIGGISDWIEFHLYHLHYHFVYLGRDWYDPPFPWHVPIVTTLFTVPVVVTVAALCGAGAHIRALIERRTKPSSHRDGDGDSDNSGAVISLLVLSMFVAWGPFLTGRAPIFGAEKHWAPAIPTLCILAALGVKAVASLAAERLVQVRLVPTRFARIASILTMIVVASAVIGASAAETRAAHPYSLSHYNALAGGGPGGADLGMNRHFWGYAGRGLVPYLNERARALDRRLPVYSHNANASWRWYLQLGLADPRLERAGHELDGINNSEFAMVIHEMHFNRHEYMIWASYGTVKPIYVLRFQGVPIASLYARDPRLAQPKRR